MTVHYEHADRIATVTLDAPETRNALSSALVADLTGHLRRAATEDVRAVVLTHTGGTFCAGADLREQAQEGGPQHGTRRMLDLLRAIVELPRPVIARINGHVRAGGVGLVAACDIAVAGPNSSFAFTEVRLGLAPAIISLTTLPALDPRAASRYLLTGEVFGFEEAERIGLITRAAGNPDAVVAELAEALRQCSPQGLAETKPLTTRRVRAAFERDAEQLQQLSARLFASPEAQEGMRAFREKRPPRWPR